MRIVCLSLIILLLLPAMLLAQEANRETFSKYPYLGSYGSLIDAVIAAEGRFKKPVINDEHRQRVKKILSLPGFDDKALPRDIKLERTWTKDGVTGTEYSWDVGYGPRTFAWLLRPEGVEGPLPGVVALHGHDGFKTLGKEKIADGPDEMLSSLADLRNLYYEGTAFATELAKQGFTVLVPDVFMWSSRKHPPENFAPEARRVSETMESAGRLGAAWTPEIRQYESAARLTERYFDQYSRTAGTSIAAIVSYEDRLAANFLVSLKQYTRAGGVGCIGLSGGGARSALLQGACDHIRAAVIVGMMSTYEHLLTRYVETHTHILFPQGLADFGDYPDLAGARVPSPLLVQYAINDGIFSIEGMRAADERFREIYTQSGAADRYHGEFFPGPHKFDIEMQKKAFQWLKENLRD